MLDLEELLRVGGDEEHVGDGHRAGRGETCSPRVRVGLDRELGAEVEQHGARGLRAGLAERAVLDRGVDRERRVALEEVEHHLPRALGEGVRLHDEPLGLPLT
jgi:hypothetical protein